MAYLPFRNLVIIFELLNLIIVACGSLSESHFVCDLDIGGGAGISNAIRLSPRATTSLPHRNIHRDYSSATVASQNLKPYL